MNWVDIVIAIFIILSILGGVKSGLIKSILSLAGLIVGILLAGRFYLPLSERLTFIPQESIARIVAFALIVILVMVVGGVLGVLLSKAASTLALGWLNRLGGAVFGFLTGALVVAAVLAAWTKFFGAGDAISESILAPILLDYFPDVLALLPDEFDSIRSFFE